MQVLLVIFLIVTTVCKKVQEKNLKTVKNIKWDEEWIKYKIGDQQIEVCPESNVMKARYECFVYDVENVKETLRR